MLLSPRPVDAARILVVDDDRDTVESMARLLRLFGHDVQTACDGYQAIELARRLRPRHVLLDLCLPGLDGYQVATRLRQERAESIVLIAITGYGRKEDDRRALSAGFDHHFVKPLDQDALNGLLSILGTRPRQSAAIAQPVALAAAGVASAASFSSEPGGRPIDSDFPPHAKPPPGMMSCEEHPTLRVSRQVEITNTYGLHLRAANTFARLAQQFQADVRVGYDGRKVNGRSILDLTTLAAGCGAWLEVQADGADAEAALEALIDLITRRFDEQDG
jgi:phosphotransferase system HPr (HPr) family protein